MASLGKYQITYDVLLRDESGRFISETRAGAAAATEEMADQIARLAAMRAPFRTGQLKGSIHTIRLSPFRMVVTSDVQYASSQESGAAPHNIPDAFGREDNTVLHPGNPATHFLGRAGTAVSAISASIVKRHLPGL